MKKSTSMQVIQELKIIPGIFQVGNKSPNFFKLAAVPWHRLNLPWLTRKHSLNGKQGRKNVLSP